MTPMSDANSALRSAFEATLGGSKHASYQELATWVREALPDIVPLRSSRHESARLQYMLDRIDLAGKSVLDIGSNCGFFALEMLRHGAARATCYEGSADHAGFLDAARDALELAGRLQVHGRYFDFDAGHGRHDVGLLLNVLHHVGDDYGDRSLSMEAARAEIARNLVLMRRHCDELVFQLGFNWKGDRNLGLFPEGTIREMVDFVERSSRGTWQVRHVGVAEQDASGAVVYRDLAPANSHRKDALGEFLNRPIFILG